MSITPASICLTCLSTTRKVYPIEDALFFASLTLLQLSDASKCRLCWECYATVRRAKKFREKALAAHAILTRQCIPTKLPLSSLGCKELNDYYFIQCYPTFKTWEVFKSGTPTDRPVSIEYQCSSQTNASQEPTTCPLLMYNLPASQKTEQETVPALPQTTDIHEKLIVKQEVIEHDPVERFENGHSPEPPFGTEYSDILENDVKPSLEFIKCESYCSDNEMEEEKKENQAYIEINAIEVHIENAIPSSIDTFHNDQIILSNIDTLQYNQPMPSNIDNLQCDQAIPSNIDIDTLQYNQMIAANTDTIEYNKKIPSNTDTIEQDQAIPSNIDTLQCDQMKNEASQCTTKDIEIASYIEHVHKCTMRSVTEEEIREVRRKKLEKSKQFRYYCDKCLEFFQSKSFVVHMEKHKESAGAFVCSICEMRFATETALSSHTTKLYRVFKCNTCSEEFTKYPSFSRHYDQCHDSTPMTCCSCGEKFPNKGAWYHHTQTSHQPYVDCSVCNKQVRKYSIKNHMKTHTSSSEPQVSCEECGKTFPGAYKLDIHIRVCHKILKPGEAYCAKCDMQFKTVALYKGHIKNSGKHDPEKRLTCKMCHGRYECPSSLKDHIERDHSNFECKQCPRRYASEKSLERHVKRVHEERVKDKICDYCGRGFANLVHLQQHIYSHMNIRPYKCKYCPSGFNYTGALYTHIKLKHKKCKK